MKKLAAVLCLTVAVVSMGAQAYDSGWRYIQSSGLTLVTVYRPSGSHMPIGLDANNCADRAKQQYRDRLVATYIVGENC